MPGYLFWPLSCPGEQIAATHIQCSQYGKNNLYYLGVSHTVPKATDSTEKPTAQNGRLGKIGMCYSIFEFSK